MGSDSCSKRIMSGILGAIDASASGGGGGPTQCADVVLSPNSGTVPLTVSVSTTTSGAHIFYTKDAVGIDPTHTGDSATGSTIRIGSNSGSVSTGGAAVVIRCLA